MGHTNFLIMLGLTWVQDVGSSLKSTWRLSINTLNISYRTKVAQNTIITHTNFLRKKNNVAHANFLLEI